MRHTHHQQVSLSNSHPWVNVLNVMTELGGAWSWHNLKEFIMNKCVLCKEVATVSYHGYSLCERCHARGHNVLGIQLAVHERKRFEDVVDDHEQELMVLQSKIAEFQNQWYVRPSLSSQLIEWFYDRRDKWYIKMMVLTLPWIPLAFAVHWYW